MSQFRATARKTISLRNIYSTTTGNPGEEEYSLKTFTSLGVAGDFEMANCSLTMDDLKSNFAEIKSQRFCCSRKVALCTDHDSIGKRDRDAFEVLMAGGRIGKNFI